MAMWRIGTHRLEHEFQTRDGYSIEAEVARVLMGLGFGKKKTGKGKQKSFPAMCRCGWLWPSFCFSNRTCFCWTSLRTTSIWKLELARGLSAAIILTLIVVLISHDRIFSDVTVNKIVEIWNKRLWFYTGHTTNTYTQKDPAATEQLQAAYRNQREPNRDSSRSLSIASATRLPKPSRSKAVSRNWRRSSAIEIPPEEKTIHFHFRSPSPAEALLPSSSGVARVTMQKKCFATSAS